MHSLETIITFITGSVLSALVSYCTTKTNNQKDLTRLQLELKYKIKIYSDKTNKKSFKKTLKAKDKILKIIYKLKLNLSLTNNYILETINTNEQEIHKEYFRNYNLISKAIRICMVNDFDQRLLTKLQEISGLINLIWGERQGYFGHLKENKEAKNNIRNKLVEYFNSVSEKVDKVESYLLNDEYKKISLNET